MRLQLNGTSTQHWHTASGHPCCLAVGPVDMGNLPQLIACPSNYACAQNDHRPGREAALRSQPLVEAGVV
jgi:hypothetical protein